MINLKKIHKILANPGVMMRKKILLADDSATIQKVFEIAFEKTGFSVVSVDNGDEAVRMAAEIAPDLVVVDVTLPGKDGFEVAAAIRGGERTKGLPVLILSGTLVPFEEGKVEACGAKGVLFKPFDTMELLEKVESLTGWREEAAPVAKATGHGAAPPAPPADEHWDFSDVLDEVQEAVPAAKPGAAAGMAGEVSSDVAKAAGKDAAGYDEFDVSVDDIGESAEPSPAAREVSPPVEHAAASEAIEEIEEIEELEEIDEVPKAAELPETPEERAGEAAEERVEAVPEAPWEAAPEAAAGWIPEATQETGTFPGTPAPAPEAPAAYEEGAGDEILRAELREQFAARAEAVFREVASEAVEKVMWEMMDRLAGEFSARIRESVESVAWEVIPATAEALIREEISRIRTQAGKPISS